MNSTSRRPEGGKSRVLIVDDDPSIRMILMAALRRKTDYEVFEAADGAIAKAILQQQAFDVVITDLLMPSMTGLELMQWAQANCPGPTWIILSGQANFEDAVKAVRLGAFDFITKPLVVLDVLLVTVRNALRQRELMAEHAEMNRRLAQQVARLEKACRILCDQSEALGEDLRRAELIQTALLPRTPPRLENYAVDVLYRPSQKVGGDLYDVSRIGARHLMTYVADAAGHGVSAAMLAVLFKHRLHLIDESNGQATEPQEVLSRVNEALIEECSKPGLFITAVFCVLDLESGQLTLASAGHPPVPLHRADGRIEMIACTGPALGVDRQACFAQTRTRLRPHDRLLLYTDGLFEAGAPADALTGEQLAQMLADGKAGGRRLLGELLAAASRRRGGASQEDDITMLLLTAAPGASTMDVGRSGAAAAPVPTAKTLGSRVLIGSAGAQTAIRIDGRGIWTHCPAFHEVCMARLEAGHAIALDLSRCDYLDSTFLGTIQEVVDQADSSGVAIGIHGVPAQVRRVFEELGMHRVVARFADEALAAPAEMLPLEAARDPDDSRRRVLKAHEVLASLNEHNRREFHKLVEGLRAETPEGGPT